MLTLPGRDRLASLRSLHAYDPVNTSPGLYAVPLTPFDSQTGRVKLLSFHRIPTKHLCILVPAHLWHLICINFRQWCKFSILIKRIDARTALYIVTIWDKFSE